MIFTADELMRECQLRHWRSAKSIVRSNSKDIVTDIRNRIMKAISSLIIS